MRSTFISGSNNDWGAIVDEPMSADVDWTLARKAAYRRLEKGICALLCAEVTPEAFEGKFLRDRSDVIEASINGGVGADYDFEETMDAIWFHVDDYVASSLNVERDAGQIDELEFVARVRVEWEGFEARRHQQF